MLHQYLQCDTLACRPSLYGWRHVSLVDLAPMPLQITLSTWDDEIRWSHTKYFITIFQIQVSLFVNIQHERLTYRIGLISLAISTLLFAHDSVTIIKETFLQDCLQILKRMLHDSWMQLSRELNRGTKKPLHDTLNYCNDLRESSVHDPSTTISNEETCFSRMYRKFWILYILRTTSLVPRYTSSTTQQKVNNRISTDNFDSVR